MRESDPEGIVAMQRARHISYLLIENQEQITPVVSAVIAELS